MNQSPKPAPGRTEARKIVLILGDQLSLTMSSLSAADRETDVVLMAEVQEEATYVRHHKKKIAFIFSAMRHFAEELRGQGWQVCYRQLADTGDQGGLRDQVHWAIRSFGATRLVVTEPGEWRLKADMATWSEAFDCPVEILADTRFVCSHGEFTRWAQGRKQLRMEHFYREMRRKTGLLMDGDQPAGGQWNFDHDNRKPAKADLFMPQPRRVELDAITREVLGLVANRFHNHFGDLEPFWFAVTRSDAEAALVHFIEHALPRFGDYQDAMLRDQRFLYHSVLSAYINCGLLDPMDVCRRVETAYRSGAAPINAAEGFIRQIIGWREYVRGIYWRLMPDYRDRNTFANTRPLPVFYWTGETEMACMRAAITQTRQEAYAHHIQRLMVTGNFALIAGIDPAEIHDWYLSVYADAFEWVELPNTLGMSQFADGGILASKPYAASGAYINRMSDYCKDCRFDVKKRSGDGACPFNALYWDFVVRNRDKLDSNPRMGMVYRTWDKMDEADRKACLATAATFLSDLD